jgi:hypothetical protein
MRGVASIISIIISLLNVERNPKKANGVNIPINIEKEQKIGLLKKNLLL